MSRPVRGIGFWMRRVGAGAGAFCVALGACAVDAGTDPDAHTAVTVAWLAARYPAAGAMVARANAAPAGRARDTGGFRIEAAQATRAPNARVPVPPGSPAARGAWRRDTRNARAELPDDATGTMRVGVGPSWGTIGVRRSGAAHASGQLDSGAVVYADGASDVDSVVFARDDGIEELLVVKGGRTEVEYDLELPSGCTLVAPSGWSGLVEARDPEGRARLRMRAQKAWDATGAEVRLRVVVERTRVRISWAAGALPPVVVDPSWESTAALAEPRVGHSATLLPSGKILIAGGGFAVVPPPPELYDIVTGTVTALSVSPAELGGSALQLPEGRVLYSRSSTAPRASLFDPVTGLATLAGTQMDDRIGATLTRLDDGSVLVVGAEPGHPLTAELFDPGAGTFAVLPPPAGDFANVTATQLGAGDVLITGATCETCGGSAVLFHEATRTFATTGALSASHAQAVRVPDGRVFLFGGTGPFLAEPWSSASSSTEIFSPASGTFSPGPGLLAARLRHRAVLLPSGQVLIAGGTDGSSPQGHLSSAELATPDAVPFASAAPTMTLPRADFTATLTPIGEIVVVGGWVDDSTMTTSIEVFDPTAASDGFVSTGSLLSGGRVYHSATLLPSGKVLVAGGCESCDLATGGLALDTAELFDPDAGAGSGAFVAVQSRLSQPRLGHTATLLPSGKVLLTGGSTADGNGLDSAELFDPDATGGAGAFTPTGRMNAGRDHHTATLLRDGDVLVVGGGAPTADLYDAANGTFVALTTGGASLPSATGAATRLASGKVLLTGGSGSNGGAAYDPVNRAFVATGSLTTGRGGHTASLLPSGRVLIVGGTPSAFDDLFDPDAAGGVGAFVSVASAGARTSHTATQLPSGRVLLAGGGAPGVPAQRYNPIAGASTDGVVPASQRFSATATLLPSGRVLFVGGVITDTSGASTTSTAELWDDGAGYAEAWRAVAALPSKQLSGGDVVAVTGTGLTGVTDSSAGDWQASSTRAPVSLWVPLDGGGPVLGSLLDWSATSATWHVPATPLQGFGLWFVASNGIPSRGVPLWLRAAPNGRACAGAAACGSGFCVDGVCCNALCDAACSACSSAKKGQGADGTCEAIAPGTDPDDECVADPASSCQKTGSCDGSGQCAIYADGTACGVDARCAQGVCAMGSPCVGVADGTACGDGGSCQGGVCTTTAASPHCDGDHTILGPDGGVSSDCSPYGCEGVTCKASCKSSGDCASGFVCHAEGRCAAAARPGAADESGCACSAPRRDVRAPSILVAALAALAARRRRRASVRVARRT